LLKKFFNHVIFIINLTQNQLQLNLAWFLPCLHLEYVKFFFLYYSLVFDHNVYFIKRMFALQYFLFLLYQYMEKLPEIRSVFLKSKLSRCDVKPIVNDRTMLPLRFVAESLGCNGGWDNDTRTITYDG